MQLIGDCFQEKKNYPGSLHIPDRQKLGIYEAQQKQPVKGGKIVMAKQYETVIGLEVHVELATKTKIFCGCSTHSEVRPKYPHMPVCTGMPGSLPVLNKKVVEYAMAVGLATNCEITQVCKFDRKNYFYPDNPQNYQISQLYLPIARDGYVEIEVGETKKKIRIHEMHMEEDAGKLIHDEWDDYISGRLQPKWGTADRDCIGAGYALGR